MPLSIYVHIPFCEVKCGYCDFFSIPRGFEDFELQRQYVDQLILEIEERAAPFSGQKIISIFFGGGTPSLLALPLFEKIMKTLQHYFRWDLQTEVTLETNPKTVSLEKLKGFRALGVTRLSIGIQSFQERFLKVLGRIHTGTEASKTVEDAFGAGFQNVSADLIFALPGQSFQDWQRDLEEAIALKTTHLSAYHLTIESGTPFSLLHRQGKLHLPAEEEEVRFFSWTRERLGKAGLEPYEISNFSQQGFESLHNKNYWHYGDSIGFGTAAASFLKCYDQNDPDGPFGRRRTNVRDLKKYLEGSWEGFLETIDLPTAMGEFCMLGLRTREGIQGKIFQKEFGRSLEDVFDDSLKQARGRGWLESYEEGFRLTPEGVLFADEVAMTFLHVKGGHIDPIGTKPVMDRHT